MSCIVASLVQVMLDPYFRTIPGFQSLIQKEWVMAGHQFLDRCNHLKRSEKEVRHPSADCRSGAAQRCAFQRETRGLSTFCFSSASPLSPGLSPRGPRTGEECCGHVDKI